MKISKTRNLEEVLFSIRSTWLGDKKVRTRKQLHLANIGKKSGAFINKLTLFHPSHSSSWEIWISSSWTSRVDKFNFTQLYFSKISSRLLILSLKFSSKIDLRQNILFTPLLFMASCFMFERHRAQARPYKIFIISIFAIFSMKGLRFLIFTLKRFSPLPLTFCRFTQPLRTAKTTVVTRPFSVITRRSIELKR